MTLEKRILEGIDACRPGSDDLDRPELADVADALRTDSEAAERSRSVQEFDVKLVQAIENVPVPAALAESLLASLEEPHEPQPAIIAPAIDTAELEPAGKPSRLLSRRTWAIAIPSAAIAATLLVALFWPTPEPLAAGNIPQMADEWYQQILERSDDAWRSLESAPHERYPSSRRVAPTARRWQRFAAQSDSRAVAYDLTPPGGQRVMLFVLETRVQGLRSTPPRRPFWTLGRSVAAWQTGPLLYVLVVEGPEGRYRQMVDSRQPPLA